jgi:hypothetical protein
VKLRELIPGKKNPAVKNDPNLILPLDDSQIREIKSEEKAKSKESGFWMRLNLELSQ